MRKRASCAWSGSEKTTPATSSTRKAPGSRLRLRLARRARGRRRTKRRADVPLTGGACACGDRAGCGRTSKRRSRGCRRRCRARSTGPNSGSSRWTRRAWSGGGSTRTWCGCASHRARRPTRTTPTDRRRCTERPRGGPRPQGAPAIGIEARQGQDPARRGSVWSARAWARRASPLSPRRMRKGTPEAIGKGRT